MAEPNFTLSNAAFALSPMVLRATTDPGKSMTLSVNNMSGKMMQVTLTADVDGVAVYDVSPLVRAFISAQFLRGNIEADKESPYGAYLTIRLDNTYALQGKMLWARAAPALVQATGIEDGLDTPAWLYPNGYVYRKGAPEGILTGYGRKYLHPTCYVMNKRTGVVKNLSVGPFFSMYDDVYGYGDRIFSSLEAGEYLVYQNNNTSYMPLDLVVEDCFPADAINDGSMAYVRFCNQWGGISYALLQVTQRSVKNKATYVQKAYSLDDAGDGNYYHVAPDRVLTGQEITPSFKAGKDKLSRAELNELQSILVSPMVDMYDAETGEWIPVYPADATVTQTNAALQEITIDFNLNTEGF